MAASGRDSGHGSLDAEDFAEALAQSVWHLKDWLKNDEQQRVLSGHDIEQFANNEAVLKVLADLCNGSKHARLTTNERSPGTSFRPTMWTGEGDVDDAASVHRVYVAVVAKDWGEPRELVDVARDGLEVWDRWLKSKGLTPPQPGQ